MFLNPIPGLSLDTNNNYYSPQSKYSNTGSVHICSIFIVHSVKHEERNLGIDNKCYLCFIIIIYLQRNENRLASLDPLILQEFEFLKNFVARVVSLRPNILLVEKTVSRLAQDMLLQYGITLVLNVKPVSQ